MRKILVGLFFAALATAAPAVAQTIPSYSYPSPGTPPSVQLQCNDTYTACLPITSTNPVPSFTAPSAGAAGGTTLVRTTAAASSLVGKASAGNLFGFNVVSGASAGYALVLNASSAPADGATVQPFRCIPLAANTGVDVNLRGQPSYHSTGITVLFSTTGCFLYTASATAFIAIDVK